MRRTKTTTALALTGAVALASGAYAIGSQAGDGDAIAAKNGNSTARGYGGPPFGGPGHGWRGGGPPMLQGLADRLGVKEADLQAALEDIRKDKVGDRRDEFARQLADALGIDVAKVTAAFEKLGPKGGRHQDFAAALAKKLGVSTAKVQQAFDQQRARRGDLDAFAKALGVTPEKLRQAFESLRADHPRDRRPGRRGPGTAALAKALGVSQAKLRAALEKVRAAHEADEQKERDAFAQALADRLNIDVQKVKDALDDFTPRFGERHHP
jgi:DNA-binding transcriptional regulator YdaS (Cro superfamily)